MPIFVKMVVQYYMIEGNGRTEINKNEARLSQWVSCTIMSDENFEANCKTDMVHCREQGLITTWANFHHFFETVIFALFNCRILLLNKSKITFQNYR